MVYHHDDLMWFIMMMMRKSFTSSGTWTSTCLGTWLHYSLYWSSSGWGWYFPPTTKTIFSSFLSVFCLKLWSQFSWMLLSVWSQFTWMHSMFKSFTWMHSMLKSFTWTHSSRGIWLQTSFSCCRATCSFHSPPSSSLSPSDSSSSQSSSSSSSQSS